MQINYSTKYLLFTYLVIGISAIAINLIISSSFGIIDCIFLVFFTCWILLFFVLKKRGYLILGREEMVVKNLLYKLIKHKDIIRIEKDKLEYGIYTAKNYFKVYLNQIDKHQLKDLEVYMDKLMN